MEPIAMAMKRRRLERDDTDNIRAVAEKKMEGNALEVDQVEIG